MYDLPTHPGCDTPYNGRRRNDSVYVVGLEEPDRMRLFPRRAAVDAIAYAKSTQFRIHHLPAHTLCHDAMVELFGA